MDIHVVTVNAKYMGSSKKGPAIPGVLTMSDAKFQWTPIKVSEHPPLNVEFSVIKAQFVNKGTKALLNMSKGSDAKAAGYAFEYNNIEDREKCREHVAKILGNQNTGEGAPTPVTKPAVPVAPGCQSDQLDQADLADFEVRWRVLNMDSKLQKLHSHVVLGGLLTETDFWSSRKHLLDEEATRGLKQKTGINTAMLADVRPVTDGRSNKVTFNLTSECILQIFKERPAVHRAFLKNVPTKTSELEFWMKYYRAEYLYRTKNEAAIAAEAADDEDLAIFTREDDIIRSENIEKLKWVDPSINLVADLADDYSRSSGHGIYRDGLKEDIEYNTGVTKRSIISDINRHGAVVLAGSLLDPILSNASDTYTVAQDLFKAQQFKAANLRPEELEQKRLDRLRNMTLNKDLQGPQEAPHVPLTIQEPRNYFDALVANAGESGPVEPICSDPAKAMDSFHEQLAAWKKNGLEARTVMDPALAFKVTTDLTREMSATNFTLERNPRENVFDSLPKAVKDDLLQQQARIHEVLRNFWSCYPTTSKLLLDKANRVVESMAQIYISLEKMKESSSANLRHGISQVLQPMFQSLDAAFTHHEENTKRRGSKRKLLDRTMTNENN